jgi:dUTP pyrophosphatase
MHINVNLLHENAVMPAKAYPEDVGYDLTIISLVKKTGKNIFMYETGVQVAPSDNGFYIEILPRSSIFKTGYILANSVGVIDPLYRGTLKVVLVKTDESMPDIILPFKGFQLIVRKIENVPLIRGEINMDTSRGSGGFGSTDNKV